MKQLNAAAIISICVVAVLVIVLVIIVWKKTGGKIMDAIKAKTDERNLNKNFDSSRGEASSETGQDPTITKAKAGTLCSQIYYACRYGGTDENAVYSALGQLNNQADWVLLKNYYEQWYEANTSHYWCERTLVGTLTDDLNDAELMRCREILEAKGITPDF